MDSFWKNRTFRHWQTNQKILAKLYKLNLKTTASPPPSYFTHLLMRFSCSNKYSKLYILISWITTFSLTGINSSRGMTDYSRTSPAIINQKLIKTGLLSQQNQQLSSPQHQQQAGFKPKPSLLKQPLSSINSNYILNRNNNNYDLPHQPQQIYRGRTLSTVGQRVSGDLHLNESLSSEALKTNVQIVLKNLQNALINSQDSLNHSSTSSLQDRFQFLNIFSSSDERACEKNNRIQNLRNLRKMSTSPADCDNTNNNMGPPSLLGCSFASDFTHDNSDYQWFVDYG